MKSAGKGRDLNDHKVANKAPSALTPEEIENGGFNLKTPDRFFQKHSVGES